MRVVTFLILLIFLSGCEQFAILSTPKKKPKPANTQLAITADQNFWTILHNGEYNKISEVTNQLTAAYLQNPQDPTLAAHLGFIHIWKITERQREKNIPATITDHILLSHDYFAQAIELNPTDARYLGFYGDTQLVIGQIFADKREEVRGYFILKRAISAWPQFNYFTAGYLMSTLPVSSKHFKEALNWQWLNLDVCAGQSVNRNNPDFSPYMRLETTRALERACWNSWIAPYNFEGFFLNMGDMLVKAGDWQRAKIIYQNAKLAKNYSSWPYKHMLEKRIINAERNVMAFRSPKFLGPDRTIMFNSGYGCTACHQN